MDTHPCHPRAIAYGAFRRLDRGPPRMPSGQAPARVERPCFNDTTAFYEEKVPRLRFAPLGTTSRASHPKNGRLAKNGENGLKRSRLRRERFDRRVDAAGCERHA